MRYTSAVHLQQLQDKPHLLSRKRKKTIKDYLVNGKKILKFIKMGRISAEEYLNVKPLRAHTVNSFLLQNNEICTQASEDLQH